MPRLASVAVVLAAMFSIGSCTARQPDQAVESAGAPRLVMATFWIRPFGDSRHVSLVGYDDPATGTVPYVLYGSITNSGTAGAQNPTVQAVWHGADGAVVHTATGRVLGPHGGDLSVLAPGESADVLVVIDDPHAAALTGASDPELVGGAR